MHRIRLIHWNAKEAGPRRDALLSAGYLVDYDEKPDSGQFRAWRAAPPSAFVIDLTLLPSHGREIAVTMRSGKATRHVPILFVEGAPEKVAAARQQLPDAVFTTWNELLTVLPQALNSAPAEPVVPKAMMDRYAGRSIAQKLGIREGMQVALIDPPRGYEQVLGSLPAAVELCEDPTEHGAMVLWFVRDVAAYQEALPHIRILASRAKVWVIRPKGLPKATLNETVIRALALEMGLVDYKICSLGEKWSGVLFAVKRETAHRTRRTAAASSS